jgi:ABC-type transporter Mla subunit MlaD
MPAGNPSVRRRATTAKPARNPGRPRRARAAIWVLDHPWFVVLALVSILFVWWALGTRSQDHHVRAAFPTAFNLTKGLDVQIDGIDAGKIGTVEYRDGKAVVEIGISDERFWPLHVGTRVKSRWGTTIGSGTRRLDVEPGPDSAAEIPEGGIIESRYTLAAVDVDEVLNTFSNATRGDLRSFMSRTDAAITGREDQINSSLPAAAGALEATGGVMADLATDSNALQGLVLNGDRLTRTLAARRPEVRDLVTVAAQTFQAFAANSDGVEQSIEQLPGTLREARGTLARLDTSVGTLDGLVSDLRPGAARLRPLARAARPALVSLADTIPSALSTVRSATKAAPRLSELFSAGSPFMQKLGPILSEMSPMFACMRPYAPEAGGAVVGLAAWMQQYILHHPTEGVPGKRFPGARTNGLAHFHPVMAMPQASLASLHSYPAPIDSELFTRLSGKKYALPRPPGLTTGQPWFQPECGAGPESVDPSKDPEKP